MDTAWRSAPIGHRSRARGKSPQRQTSSGRGMHLKAPPSPARASMGNRTSSSLVEKRWLSRSTSVLAAFRWTVSRSTPWSKDVRIDSSWTLIWQSAAHASTTRCATRWIELESTGARRAYVSQQRRARGGQKQQRQRHHHREAELQVAHSPDHSAHEEETDQHGQHRELERVGDDGLEVVAAVPVGQLADLD